MSDTTKSAASGASAEGPKFTERELQLLGWAMQSLKSGPPEIDTEKLAAFANMSNPRSAGNAWSNLKKKLMAPADGTAPPTPKKAAGRKKKDDAGETEEPTPKKTPRKRANKESEDGDASPKKKTRAKPKPKEEPEDETAEASAEHASADETKSGDDDATDEDEED